MTPLQFLAYLVIFCFEVGCLKRKCCSLNALRWAVSNENVAPLKSPQILPPPQFWAGYDTVMYLATSTSGANAIKSVAMF